MTFHNAKPGDRCTNGAFQERWTCPNCYHDHEGEVDKCENCGIPLQCSREDQWVALCEVVAPREEEAA